MKMTLHLPAETAMALAVALNDPRNGLALKRSAAMDAIEELINFLDDTEGDPDLEPNGDELDASFPEGWRLFSGCANEDDERDDHDEDGGDDEPSLASRETQCLPVDYFYSQRSLIVQSGPMGSQEDWAVGSRNDGENNVEDEGEATNEDGGDILDENHDAEEDCGDSCDEPSFYYKGERDRPAASGLVARALSMQRKCGVSLDTGRCAEIAPGVVRIGAW